MPSSIGLLFNAFVIIITAFFETNQGAAIPKLDEKDVMAYLEKYGHLQPKRLTVGIVKNSFSSPSETDDFSKALKDFQRTVGLKETGVLDNETADLMKKPRCGVTESGFRSRRKRQTDLRWPMLNLRYRFFSYSVKLPTIVTRETMKEAFRQWTEVTPLVITEATPSELADISILFTTGDHGDGFPFDGPGGGKTGNTLAHTFFPTDGRTHYDDSEDWTVGSYSGYNLLSVATHELGHVLGLNHSPDYKDIMYALYTPYTPNFSISPRDVAAIQRLYGPTNIERLPLTPSPDATTLTITTTTSTTTTTTTTAWPTILPRIGTPHPSNNDNYRSPILRIFFLSTPPRPIIGTQSPYGQGIKGMPANVAQSLVTPKKLQPSLTPTSTLRSGVTPRDTPKTTPRKLLTFFTTISKTSRGSLKVNS